MDPLDLSYDHYFYIMLSLKAKDFDYFCQLNEHAHNICHDPYFWRQKLRQDFPEHLNHLDDLNSIESAEKLRKLWFDLTENQYSFYLMIGQGYINPETGMYMSEEVSFDQLNRRGRDQTEDLLRYIRDSFPERIMFLTRHIAKYEGPKSSDSYLVYPIYYTHVNWNPRSQIVTFSFVIEREHPWVLDLSEHDLETYEPIEKDFITFPLDQIGSDSIKDLLEEEISSLAADKGEINYLDYDREIDCEFTLIPIIEDSEL